jgi:uncharacterized protein (TIGR03382 family)
MHLTNDNRLIKAVWLALTLGIVGSTAQAALVQINTNYYLNFIDKFSHLYVSNIYFGPRNVEAKIDITLDGNIDNVSYYFSAETYNPFVIGFRNYNDENDLNLYSSLGYTYYQTLGGAPYTWGGSGAIGQVYFTDDRINQGQKTSAMAEVVYTDNYPGGILGNSVTLTRVVFNNTSSTDLSGFNSATTYNEWSPTSTPVPEPGTFLPAALLVAGALLRRRRGRASRSGGAVA